MEEPIRILIFVEPLIEMERPYFKLNWATEFSSSLIRTLRDSEAYYQFAIAMNEPIAEHYNEAEVQKFVIEQDEILSFFLDKKASEILTELYHASPNDQKIEGLARHFFGRLKNFDPDIILSFSPVPYLQKAFPNALVLHHEYSLFSRPPFPETWYLDPSGNLGHSIMFKHWPALAKSFTWGVEDQAHLVELKKCLQKAISLRNPFHELLAERKANFRSLVLVPLQFSNFYGFDGLCKFKSQYEFLEEVLRNAPSGVGIVATTHPEYPVLDRESAAYLQKKYGNLIWCPEFELFQSASQYLFEYVDAVLTVSSSVALQALLWDKKIVSLGLGFMTPVSDAKTLKELGKALDAPSQSRDSFVGWILSHYAISTRYLRDPQWLDKFLRRSLKGFRQGISIGSFFLPIDSFSKIKKSILEDLNLSFPRVQTLSPSLRDRLNLMGHVSAVEWARTSQVTLLPDGRSSICQAALWRERDDDTVEVAFRWESTLGIKYLQWNAIDAAHVRFEVVSFEVLGSEDDNWKRTEAQPHTSNGTSLGVKKWRFGKIPPQMEFLFLAPICGFRARIKIVSIGPAQASAYLETQEREVRQQIDGLLQSRSWRYTLPLRQLMGFFSRHLR